MEPTRRGMMGLFAGAVAAGPKLAESVISEVEGAASMIAPADHQMKLVNAMYQGNLALPQEAKVNSFAWEMNRLRDIKRKLRQHQVAPFESYELIELDKLNIKSLKSVSVVNKQRIYLERRDRRNAERERLNMLDEMAVLLGFKKREETDRYGAVAAPLNEEPW